MNKMYLWPLAAFQSEPIRSMLMLSNGTVIISRLISGVEAVFSDAVF